MKFLDCFTIDLRAQPSKRYSARELLRKLAFNTGYRVVVYYRIAVYLKEIRFPKRTTNLLCSLIFTRISRVPDVEFHTKFEIGEGLNIYHPHDIVLGVGCRISKNVNIYNGVTLGARKMEADDENKDTNTRYPTVEEGVTIFSGAKIIGPVTIGKNSIVGANSVVNQSFPENSIIAGSPGRLVGKRK